MILKAKRDKESPEVKTIPLFRYRGPWVKLKRGCSSLIKGFPRGYEEQVKSIMSLDTKRIP